MNPSPTEKFGLPKEYFTNPSVHFQIDKNFDLVSLMKLTCILSLPEQFIITEVGAFSLGQLLNSELHSPGQALRYRRAHVLCALPSQFPLMLKHSK